MEQNNVEFNEKPFNRRHFLIGTATIVGALIIAIIQNGLVIMAVAPFWQFIAVGAIIILAVLIDQAKARMA